MRSVWEPMLQVHVEAELHEQHNSSEALPQAKDSYTVVDVLEGAEHH